MITVDTARYIFLPSEDKTVFKGLQGFEFSGYHFHTNLEHYQAENGSRQLLLLGFAVHVEFPEKNETEILQYCLQQEGSLQDALDNLAGNFLVFEKNADSLIAITDAAAVVKLYHYSKGAAVIAGASDPKLLREHFNLAYDESGKVNGYFKSEAFEKHQVWLGSKTNIQGVSQLLPNHVLHLTSAKAKRYFPEEKLPEISLEDAVKELDFLLCSITKGLGLRYKLNLGLTAGWDSRLVLASTRKEKAQCYTFKREGLKDSHVDFVVPKKITDALDLPYKVIPVSFGRNKEAEQALHTAFEIMDKRRPGIVVEGFSQFSENDVVLVGTVSEICKNYYDDVFILDGKSLAKASHYQLNSYVSEHFQEKYEELSDLEKTTGMDLRDLAHWEQDITNFAAQNTLQTMHAVRIVSPFNCRRLIKLCLSVPREYRDKQGHKLYETYLHTYWPELMKFPVNPDLKTKLILLGKKLGLYSIYKKLSTLSRS